MKRIQRLIFVFSLILPTAVIASDLEMINRPVNTSGLTGLLITTAPYALSPKTVEIGVSALTENSLRPDFTLSEYPLSVSIGLGNGMEMAVRGSYFYRNEASVNRTRGMGDSELSWKWNFIQQPEYSASPAVAVFITGIAPTAEKESRLNSVSHWGARLGLAVGSEISLGDHVLAIYADAQGGVQDLSDENLRDDYYLVNAGLLLPISKYRNLQMFIEYNRMGDRDIITVDGVDFSAVTYGLRLVGERFNLSIGSQSLHKKEEGFDDSSRIIGVISLKL